MKSDTSKIKLAIAINFMTSKNNNHECIMHSKSDNIEMINDKEDEVTEELFQIFFFSRYQAGLETVMKGSNFMLHCVYLLYYKYHKINLKRGES